MSASIGSSSTVCKPTPRYIGEKLSECGASSVMPMKAEQKRMDSFDLVVDGQFAWQVCLRFERDRNLAE